MDPAGFYIEELRLKANVSRLSIRKTAKHIQNGFEIKRLDEIIGVEAELKIISREIDHIGPRSEVIKISAFIFCSFILHMEDTDPGGEIEKELIMRRVASNSDIEVGSLREDPREDCIFEILKAPRESRVVFFIMESDDECCGHFFINFLIILSRHGAHRINNFLPEYTHLHFLFFIDEFECLAALA